MTFSALLKEGKKRLSEAGIEEYGYDARELLLFAFGLSSAGYLMKTDEEPPEAETKAYRRLIEKRASRIPLQRLTGKANFYGREFRVFDNVLIPRYDTEILTERAIKILDSFPEGRVKRVLDLCSGSGCIGITIRLERPETVVTLSDISESAVNASEKNARLLKADVDVIKSDLFENISGKFGLIVSNPPYITEEEMKTLMPEVRDHDPHDALYGGNDGLSFYRRIVQKSAQFLENGGFLAFETGYAQAGDVEKLMTDAGFTETESFCDFSGIRRVVQGKYNA